MRQKIVLRRRAVPSNITLPNGTSFAARYERVSKKNLPGNIRVTNARIISPRKGEPRRKSKVCLGKYPYLGQGKENKKKIQKIMRCSNWFGTSGKKAIHGLKSNKFCVWKKTN